MNYQISQNISDFLCIESCTLYAARTQKGTNIARFYLWILCVVWRVCEDFL